MSRAPELRQQVSARAGFRCEYCRTWQRVIGMPLVVDHIVPRVAGGSDDQENLCAARYRCNEYKGAKTHAVDPLTGEVAPLFNPRLQSWSDHFAWANGGTHVVGLTPTGRVTVIALRLNNEYLVEARTGEIACNWHPPSG
jgi:5-methylcytosine-specific restriction endonuclease McrA